jgi:hypothetical protein
MYWNSTTQSYKAKITTFVMLIKSAKIVFLSIIFLYKHRLIKSAKILVRVQFSHNKIVCNVTPIWSHVRVQTWRIFNALFKSEVMEFKPEEYSMGLCGVATSLCSDDGVAWWWGGVETRRQGGVVAMMAWLGDGATRSQVGLAKPSSCLRINEWQKQREITKPERGNSVHIKLVVNFEWFCIV